MTPEAWKEILRKEHFNEVWTHTDPAGHFYEGHSHPVDTVHVVLQGSIIVWAEGKEHLIQAGERLDLAKHMSHSAKIGPQGCTFLTGVRI